MIRVPPQNAHYVAVLNAPDSLYSRNAKRHQLINIVLLNLGQSIPSWLFKPLRLDWMGAGTNDLLPAHSFKFM